MTYLLPDGKEVKVNRPGPSIPKQLIPGFSQWLEEQIGAKSVAAFAGSLPPGFSPEDFVALAQRCGKKCPIVLDTSSLSLPQLLSCGPWVIKPNLEEMEALTKTRLETLAQQTQAGRALLEKGIRYVLISLGGQGLLGICQEQAFLVKVPKVPVLSTVGAGDSALAGFLLALSTGKAFPDALQSAAAFGTAAVATEGTNPPSRQKVKEIYRQTQLCQV